MSTKPPETPEDGLPADDLDDGEEIFGVVTFFSPEEVEAMGALPPEAIIGHLEGQGSPLERFRPNPDFGRFMQRVIRERAGEDPALQDAARQQGSGWLYIVDQRALTRDPGGRIPPEDIVGAVQVQGGRVVPGSYQGNDQHRLFTEKGLVQLPDRLHEILKRELRKLAEQSKSQ